MTFSSCRTAVAMEPAAAPATVRRPGPTAAATAKRTAPTSTTTHALSDIRPRLSGPLTLARPLKRRGEATSSRFLPRCLELGLRGRRRERHYAFIKAHHQQATKKRKRDNHVQRTTAAARRPDDDSYRGQDRRRTDRK